MFTKITYIKNVILYVEAKGKLDIYSTQDYIENIKEHLRYHIQELVLEFSQISYVSSIGLRAILELHKIMQEQNKILKLKNVNEEVMHAFKLTGFDKFLIIENDSNED